MQIRFPQYYQMFQCIASACPDSCCKEWEVDVDAAAAAYYRTLEGDLGERLRLVLKDTEDGTMMTIENGRCPMWCQDGLCRIQAELGHDALCQVCQEFPRLRHDYGDFVENGLELSCPEAARLILSQSPAWVTELISGGEEPEYEEEVMSILLETRNTVLDFLDKTQAEKLCENVMAEIKSIAVLEEGSHFRAVNDVTGKPFEPEMVIKNGQVTAVGKTISTKPKNLLGKKEGTKFVISGKQYVIKDIK